MYMASAVKARRLLKSGKRSKSSEPSPTSSQTANSSSRKSTTSHSEVQRTDKTGSDKSHENYNETENVEFRKSGVKEEVLHPQFGQPYTIRVSRKRSEEEKRRQNLRERLRDGCQFLTILGGIIVVASVVSFFLNQLVESIPASVENSTISNST